MLKKWKYILIAIAAFLLFSYKLTEVPKGLTIDEGAFGYNAILISKTLRDENNRLLPAFVLSINGKDWRQPVAQYSQVAMFKIFGPSIYNLRIVSVVTAVVSCLLILYLSQKLTGNTGSFIALLSFVTAPAVFMHTHLGLDNITPIPFVLLWLIGIYLFGKNRSTKYLVLSAVSLGVGFYSHKSMRGFATVWVFLTLIYLALPFLKTKRSKVKKSLRPLFVFIASIFPFYAIIPFLEYKYAGAVLGQTGFGAKPIHEFLMSYLSSFDLSFLYITGDVMPHHSTGKHGMFLLATLPFFLFGILKTIKENSFWKLILLSFFLGPVLFGFPGSIHRASRMLALAPIYTLVCGLGATAISKGRKIPKLLLPILSTLIIFNFVGFADYYWNSYQKDYGHIFYKTDSSLAYEALHDISKSENLNPYMSLEIYKNETAADAGVTDIFQRYIYFPSPTLIGVWNKEESLLPEGSVLISRSANIEGLSLVEQINGGYYLWTGDIR